ncbi:hypothetical protein [Streptomyces mirabilis]|uniref:hypothetical protein n=1 Tax=Streptomyces mirabilis TaxID=68239 RepID=UPI0036CCF384
MSLPPEPPLPHTRVALGPLSEDTVRELTAVLLDAPASPTLAALAAAEGNARLLIEGPARAGARGWSCC